MCDGARALLWTLVHSPCRCCHLFFSLSLSPSLLPRSGALPPPLKDRRQTWHIQVHLSARPLLHARATELALVQPFLLLLSLLRN